MRSGRNRVVTSRDYFPGEQALPAERSGRTPAPAGAPSGADLVIKVCADACARFDRRLTGPVWAARRVADLDAAIADLVRQRDRLLADIR